MHTHAPRVAVLTHPHRLLLLLPACECSLQMRPSAWKGTELRASAPCRHTMPLVSEAPHLQVLQDLPPIGTALPVVMDPGAVPSTGLPQVGDWVKIKVVGVAAVQVRMCQESGHSRGAVVPRMLSLA
jgi:hypothetical protein